MNWEAAGALGEIVGAFAVVISLLYLSVQIRNQNRESRALATHEIWAGFRASIAALGTPELAMVFTKSLSNEELSDSEQMQLLVLIQSVLRVWEEAFMQWRKGRLDDDVWEIMTLQFSLVLDSRPFRDVWAIRKNVFGTEFRNFVDSLQTQEYDLRAAGVPKP